MPNPRDTMMTNMRARVLLAHDTSSANTIKPDTLYPLLLRLLYSAVNTAFSNIPEKQSFIFDTAFTRSFYTF